MMELEVDLCRYGLHHEGRTFTSEISALVKEPAGLPIPQYENIM
jgi:hypothetical protein